MNEWFEAPTEPGGWLRESTYIRCFDAEDKEFLNVGSVTGLHWRLKNEDGKVYYAVDPSCIPACRYEFTGAFMLAKFVEGARPVSHFSTEGVSDGTGYVPFACDCSPWDSENKPGVFVSYDEWSARLGTCFKCPLFDHKTAVCTADDSLMSTKAIHAGESCPEERWSVSADFDVETYKLRQEEDISKAVHLADQAEFESEWKGRKRAGK